MTIGMWIRRKVQKGTKTGQKIGFPTLNFNVGNFSKSYKPGVYACNIHIAGKLYSGALYFGPRLQNRVNVLEIFVQNFSRNIYGQFVQFHVSKKIRDPKRFTDTDTLKKQIRKDLLSL